jgi:Protein of unknown function (DUF5132)
MAPRFTEIQWLSFLRGGKSMGIHLTSFLLGLGSAWMLPLFGRILRPIAVQSTVAGMTIFDEARRAIAEQVERLEDIAAEARARREEMAAEGEIEEVDETEEEGESRERVRRRGNGASRRRAS